MQCGVITHSLSLTKTSFVLTRSMPLCYDFTQQYTPLNTIMGEINIISLFICSLKTVLTLFLYINLKYEKITQQWLCSSHVYHEDLSQ